MEAGPVCVGAFYQNMRRAPSFKANRLSRRPEQLRENISRGGPHGPVDTEVTRARMADATVCWVPSEMLLHWLVPFKFKTRVAGISFRVRASGDNTPVVSWPSLLTSGTHEIISI